MSIGSANVEQDKGTILRWLVSSRSQRFGCEPDAFDPEAVASTLRIAKWFFGDRRYFPLDVRGWEHVPPPPVMLVSNHSGGTTIPDVWGLLVAWYARMGLERPLHPLAHELVFSLRSVGEFFARRGVLRAGRGMAQRVLCEARRDVLVLPGGDQDTWRPYSRRYSVEFAGRAGYARAAIEAQVPIVPIAHAGAHETLIVLTTGRRIARALGFPRLARAEIFPIHISLPFGLTFGPTPHIPTPTTLRYRIGPAIMPPDVNSHSRTTNTERAAADLDATVRAAIQSMLDELRRESRRT